MNDEPGFSFKDSNSDNLSKPHSIELIFGKKRIAKILSNDRDRVTAPLRPFESRIAQLSLWSWWGLKGALILGPCMVSGRQRGA